MQGKDHQSVTAISKADLANAELPDNERALLEFAGKITQHAYKISDRDTQLLREFGWTDDQIAEAVYVTAMFALFNRVADAFGLPGDRDRDLR